ncbi:phosphotransferase [Klugiella xanthotipulae]|uniref:Aminoglycoside phosphotransferase (APT) family kinase protein n=1 Tax=Klugiella xanthotipulae TaxID=244735 RepID=A0A543HRR4_9MICO|nr:phosphotransferase [Klugiella xanthotipulae]TQM61031.1 aminoglycoside phosphotransferase (APT) family kinase protein [Klugiella xanthotipulae]
MGRSHLTLAALATSAVPNLEVTQVRQHTYGGSGDFSSAMLSTPDGNDLIIRIPTTQAAETLQSADLLGLAALTPGARHNLPFRVAEALGQTRAGNTRAIVYTYLDGVKVDGSRITADSTIVPSIARALQAIHNLPSSLIVEAGLPVRSAIEAREETTRLIARGEATRLVPSSVLTRWQRVMADRAIWQFHSTVVNGALTSESFLYDDADSVSGVLDWSQLRVADPATDLAWLAETPGDTMVTVVAEYARLRDIPDPASLLRRAQFYSELDIVRWLLHGKDTHSTEIVDDAVGMLGTLVDRISGEAVTEKPVMGVTEAVDLLGQVPGIIPGNQHGADGLLDDPELQRDTDFDEDDSAEHSTSTATGPIPVQGGDAGPTGGSPRTR